MKRSGLYFLLALLGILIIAEPFLWFLIYGSYIDWATVKKVDSALSLICVVTPIIIVILLVVAIVGIVEMIKSPNKY